VKWVFLLCLLAVGGAASVMGLITGYRWLTSMQTDVKLVPGEALAARAAMPAGIVPRERGELVVTREAYASRKNPVAASAASVARGGALFAIYCTPCHGAGGKGDGPVTPRFIPPPDLTSPQVQGRPDGHMAYYIGYGGAIMPAYGEAISVTERWDLVNFVRSLAKKQSS
jgi:mono/diheme cytochrome c family protein